MLGFRRRPQAPRDPPPRPRLVLGDAPLVYAIGDVHGHLGLLAEIEDEIVADARRLGEAGQIVMLGDYVDRGPKSRQVIEHLLGPPPGGMRRHCLVGNHEVVMLGFLADPLNDAGWLQFGGIETLASYGLALEEVLERAEDDEALTGLLETAIPATHRAFMAGLPVLAETETDIFVHAGLRPGVPLEGQNDEDLVWIRDFFRESYAEFGRRVVHGHTPRETPLLTDTRIAIDTGAFHSGRLTAVRLLRGAAPKIFST